ncbi:MAG TPA: SUF system NifU family Fe-S cluster assembly protein [Myxococcales bacterium]
MTDLYQKLLVDHGKHPRNFRALPGADRIAEGSNPLCGDELTVKLLLRKDRIEEIAFQGAGCAVSIASASMMTLAVKGQLAAQVELIAAKVRRLVAGEKVEGLGDLASLSGVAQFPARVKCALLAWRALEAALAGTAGRVTTE